jgi:hypothetical protein
MRSRLLALCALVFFVVPAPAQEKKEKPDRPPYPRVNLAPWYEVEPGWPKAPKGVQWGHVPGVAVDAKDNVYVFTRAKPPVQVYAPDGTHLRSWGSDTIETAHHLKIDAEGHVWIADIGLHVVRKCSPEGKILQTFGLPGEKGCDERRMNMPTDMVVTPTGDVFVSDGYGNNRIVHFDKTGKFVKAWGQLGIGPNDFSLPHAIALDSKGRLFIADRNNTRIQVYDQSGKLLDSWANVIVPWGFHMTAQDELWCCGSSPMPWRHDEKYPDAPLSCPPKDQIVVKYDASGKVKLLATFPKGEDDKERPGDLNWVHAVAVDSKGNLYLGDIIGKRVQKFALRK